MGFITLFQLTQTIRQQLEQNLEPHYWVVAEIGEMRVTQKGHCYLDLVEHEGQHLTAKLRGTIWAYDYSNLSSFFKSVTGKPLQPGMKVLVKAAVQYHELYGLSVTIRDIDPNFTLGERARQRRKIIDQLEKEGLMDQNRGLRLPLVPQRIAIVSAETAAGYGDFIKQLTQYQYAFFPVLFKSIMQGAEAVPSLISALEKVFLKAQAFDVLVIIRGGGSQVDLDCFDNYEVAKMVANSPIPVLTGIGHDRDETIVDLVAHTRLKTPTAVAEFLLSGMSAFDQQLNLLAQRLKVGVMHQIQSQSNRLLQLGSRINYQSRALLQQKRHQQILLQQKLINLTDRYFENGHQKLMELQKSLQHKPIQVVARQRQVLEGLESRLKLGDPQRILARGFSITYKHGEVLKEDNAVEPGDELTTKTSNQTIISIARKIEPGES